MKVNSRTLLQLNRLRFKAPLLMSRTGKDRAGSRVRAQTAVVIVDHGSRREEANKLLTTVVDAFRQKTEANIVEGAHMEIAKPDISDAISPQSSLKSVTQGCSVVACVDQGADHIVIAPFFLSPGRHSRQDIPRLVEEALGKQEKEVTYSITDTLGSDPLIVEILDKRVSSALKD